MNQQGPAAFPLFDLLARRWMAPSPVESVVFNVSSSAAAAPLRNGALAVVATADAEPPEKRMLIDASGRRTIAPRQGEPRAAIFVPPLGGGQPARALAGPDDGFVVACGDASLWRVSADGLAEPVAPAQRGGLVGAARSNIARLTVLVTGEAIMVSRDDGARAAVEAGAQAVAISPDGAWIAFGRGAELSFAASASPFAPTRRYVCPGVVNQIVWRPDGRFVAAICESGGLGLLDWEHDRFGALGDFPTRPRSVVWSTPANALVASGGFRIVAWDFAYPPFDGERRGALETGRAGLVAVVEVAAHPARRLVAAAFANGQIVIAEPGRRDELLLQVAGAEPSALGWSPDGRTLAIAAPDGLSLIALPDALFK